MFILHLRLQRIAKKIKRKLKLEDSHRFPFILLALVCSTQLLKLWFEWSIFSYPLKHFIIQQMHKYVICRYN